MLGMFFRCYLLCFVNSCYVFLLFCCHLWIILSCTDLPERCYTDKLWLIDELKWVWHLCCDMFQLVPSAIWVSCLHWGGSRLRPAVSKWCLMPLSVHITPSVARQVLEEDIGRSSECVLWGNINGQFSVYLTPAGLEHMLNT